MAGGRVGGRSLRHLEVYICRPAVTVAIHDLDLAMARQRCSMLAKGCSPDVAINTERGINTRCNQTGTERVTLTLRWAAPG